MAIPTITAISPVVGHTGGPGLVEILGTGFQTWTIPQVGGQPLPPPWPTVAVLFGTSPGTDVAVISGGRLFVLPPPSPLPMTRPAYSEGVVSVTVQNLSAFGVPIAGEITTVPNAYTYSRAQLGLETDYGRVVRAIVRVFRRGIINNVSISTHSDFDFDTSDMLNVVDVAQLPALVIFGPTILENRFYSVNGRYNLPVDGNANEMDRRRPPATDDLSFTFVGITDQKQEALGLQSATRQFFKNNPWIFLDRDPNDPLAGQVAYDMYLDAAGMQFLPPVDQKSNLRSFSGSFVVRGFNHEDLAGFDQTDRVARTHVVLPPEPPAPPPLSEEKTIVSFVFPFGIGVIGDGTIAVSVPSGTDLSLLVPVIEYDGASISPPSGLPTDFTAPVTYTVTAADSSTKDYVVTVTVSVPPPSVAMRIGTNFWYHTPLADNWSGETAMVAGINWLTAYGSGVAGLADTNIWESAWLAELEPYSTLRFMDWGNTNFSQLVTWGQRMLPTDPNNYAVYIDGDSPPNNPGVAYEWMIDLCNRTQKDLWLCLPAKSDSNYWLQLAQLVHTKLAGNLKVYVEYSNETWNGSFGQFQYTIDQGVLGNLPGDNQYYQGQAYALWQSLKIFAVFEDVFGAPQMGSRVLRVFSYGGNMDTGRLAMRAVYKDVVWDPRVQTIDRLAIAPYIGNELDGLSASIQAQFHQAINDTLSGQIAEAVTDLAEFHIAKLITYEGGQSLYANSAAWSTNAVIYDEYTYMLDHWAQHFALFMHYTHTGKWTNASGQSSWGAKDHTGQDISLAHKYRAIVEWLLANP